MKLVAQRQPNQMTSTVIAEMHVLSTTTPLASTRNSVRDEAMTVTRSTLSTLLHLIVHVSSDLTNERMMYGCPGRRRAPTRAKGTGVVEALYGPTVRECII